MPAMLMPMLLRLDLYTGRVGNTMHLEVGLTASRR